MSLASSSLVLLLNDDVLAYIFYLNTHTSQTKLDHRRPWGNSIFGLNTTRHTSQVCRAWRKLILQSPTIWANAINLGPLARASDDWIREVLSRTRGLKLSISGPVPQSPRMPPFIIPLLEENWDRVRQLDLYMLPPGYTEKRFWDIFWTRPAPSLEDCVICGHIPSAFEAIRKDGMMSFSGSAPMLRHIHFPRLRFDHSVTWLPQLLSLTLAGPIKLITALKVVECCPRLESLDISVGMDESVDEISWTREICLPDLRQLSIGCGVMESLILLSNISPRTGCALSLSTDKPRSDLDTGETFKNLLKIFWRYAIVFFDTYRPVQLVIDISDMYMTISTRRNNEVAHFRPSEFRLSVHPDGFRSINVNDIDEIISHLSGVSLTSIHDFHFKLSVSFHWYPTTRESIQVFRLLTSVEKMTLTPSALLVLNDLSDSVTRFPCLITLTMVGISRVEGRTTELKEGLQVFLSCRIEAGNPLRTLYITTFHDDHPVLGEDWVFLSREFETLRCFQQFFVEM